MPAVIVPWPGAAENHQVDNARELSDHHGAVLIEERDLDVDRLISEIAGHDVEPAPARRDVGCGSRPSVRGIAAAGSSI